MKDILTTAEVAEMLDRSPAAVTRWCRLGMLLGAFQMGTGRGAQWAIPRTALEGFTLPRSGPKRKSR